MSGPVDYVIVIPARYDSQRLPGKMLLDVMGKPLLQHAWERAMKSSAAQVVIATDDERIRAAARDFGAEVKLTAVSHPSGSDRIAECARLMHWDEDRIVVNLQGDEPLMPAVCLDQVAKVLSSHPEARVATLYTHIEDPAEVHDPNVVKVVGQDDDHALLFSRSAIPFARDFASVSEAMQAGLNWRRHLGLYAYRRAALDWFVNTAPTPLEKTEKLEQLRFIESGQDIILERARAHIPPGVDTAEDLERVKRSLESP